ncbi:MAG: thioredoxin fold domain-containing protein [Burkholderiales bacterium]|nr:MAG: thioredoxin fold domain-containing protein [Burkholderiales bacterium]
MALRLNGYMPPRQFDLALDYVAGRQEKRLSFGDYQRQQAAQSASGKLVAEPWLLPRPLDLARSDGRPLLVVFEQGACAACEEMHAEGFVRPEIKDLLARMRVAQVDIGSAEALRLPDGQSLSMSAWAQRLNIIYTPSLLFFDAAGQEVFRVEGYLRPFHLASSLDYVASGAYRQQPEFQRFIEARAAARRARGERINLLQ